MEHAGGVSPFEPCVKAQAGKERPAHLQLIDKQQEYGYLSGGGGYGRSVGTPSAYENKERIEYNVEYQAHGVDGKRYPAPSRCVEDARKGSRHDEERQSGEHQPEVAYGGFGDVGRQIEQGNDRAGKDKQQRTPCDGDERGDGDVV